MHFVKLNKLNNGLLDDKGWPGFRIMGLIQNVAFVALFSGAYMSNPDEESFKKFLEMEYPINRSLRMILEKVLLASMYENSN